MDMGRVLKKLDAYLAADDQTGAERHLNYWLMEAEYEHDVREKYTILNELIGLYRKNDMREKGLAAIAQTASCMETLCIAETVSAASGYINMATAYKAFDAPEEALSLYEKARELLEFAQDGEEVKAEEAAQFGALYNNMAVTLGSLSRTEEALLLYEKALQLMIKVPGSEPELAVTYLNMAELVEAAYGPEAGGEKITAYLEAAVALMGKESIPRDGHYAFVAEKTAPGFRYYGYFAFAKQLEEEAAKIRAAAAGEL